MRIGLDFDNTIADYDGVFHRAALERGLIEPSLPAHKNAVRDALNAGDPDAFTELQGHVYGARMDLAKPYPGVADFIATARRAGHDLVIVSHKTRHPLRGPAHDLHAAARHFLIRHGISAPAAIPEDAVFFEATQAAKVARVGALGLDLFIDDLPDVLDLIAATHPCRTLLFSPVPGPPRGHETCASWAELTATLEAPCPT